LSGMQLDCLVGIDPERGPVMTRLRTLVMVTLVMLIGTGGAFISAVAQDGASSDFTPFEEPVAQPGGALPGDVDIQLVKVAEGLIDPVNVTNAGDGSGRIFVIQ